MPYPIRRPTDEVVHPHPWTREPHLPSRKVQENTTRIYFQVGTQTIKARKLYAPLFHPRNSLIVQGCIVCPDCLGHQALPFGETCDSCSGLGFWDLAAIDLEQYRQATNLCADQEANRDHP